MNSALLFSLVVLVLGSAYALHAYGGIRNTIDYLKSHPTVLSGIKIFAGVAITAGLVFALINPSQAHAADYKKGTWFAYGEGYVGLDHTKHTSPQCVGGSNDKVTSNGGIRINIYQSYDERFEFNSKYTHHSCAFAIDRNVYDAVGFEVTYKFWSRK